MITVKRTDGKGGSQEVRIKEAALDTSFCSSRAWTSIDQT